MEIVRDNRIGNAILRRIMKQEDCTGEVYMDSRFHYVEFTDTDDIWRLACASIIYNGYHYRTRYIDGCFNPYLVRMAKAKED